MRYLVFWPCPFSCARRCKSETLRARPRARRRGQRRGRGRGRGRGQRGGKVLGKAWLLALARRDEGETRIDRHPPASCALIAIPALVFARTLFSSVRHSPPLRGASPIAGVRWRVGEKKRKKRTATTTTRRREHEGRGEDGRESADRRGLQAASALEPEAHLLSQSRGDQPRLDGDRGDIQSAQTDAEGEVEGPAGHVPRRAEEGPGVPQEQVPPEPTGMDPLQEPAVPQGADAAAAADLGARRPEDGGRAAAERGRGRERCADFRLRRRPRRSGRDRRSSAVDGRRRRPPSSPSPPSSSSAQAGRGRPARHGRRETRTRGELRQPRVPEHHRQSRGQRDDAAEHLAGAGPDERQRRRRRPDRRRSPRGRLPLRRQLLLSDEPAAAHPHPAGRPQDAAQDADAGARLQGGLQEGRRRRADGQDLNYRRRRRRVKPGLLFFRCRKREITRIFPFASVRRSKLAFSRRHSVFVIQSDWRTEEAGASKDS